MSEADAMSPEQLPEEVSDESTSSHANEDEFEYVDVSDGDEQIDSGTETIVTEKDASGNVVRRKRRKRKVPKGDADERRLLGRRALCKTIAEIAPAMKQTEKRRVLKDNPFAKGMVDPDLTQLLVKEADKLSHKDRVLSALDSQDEDFGRGQLKSIMMAILLQEETYSCEDTRLDEKVIEFEKDIVKRAKAFDWDEFKKRDQDRWHHLDTYRIVLDAAWSDDGAISMDEARLLGVLRKHLNISAEEHWLLSASLKRFPKDKNAVHNPIEIADARNEQQRNGLVWSYRDESNRDLDVIPAEIAAVIRQERAGQELQRANYRRLLNHNAFMLADLRSILQRNGLDRSGNKSELIDRIVMSNIKPSEVMDELEKDKLASICTFFGLKGYGNKSDLIQFLIDFFDDLTFAERTTRDEREVWYNNYELLACRSYAELRAKKIISKDLEVERMFEDATEFLFKTRLHVQCDRANSENRADGRLPLENDQSILWDCKSAETQVNLQDHLETQFDSYLRKERDGGKTPLAFLVIGPTFTSQSLKLTHQYKSRTNWDVVLVTAEGLKHLAERWAEVAPEKPFPVRLLNQSAVIIDKERVEYLLSLA